MCQAGILSAPEQKVIRRVFVHWQQLSDESDLETWPTFAVNAPGHLEAVVVSVVSHAASAAFAAIVALAHQTSSSSAVFVEGSNPASISWNGLFPNIGCTVLRSLPPI